MYFSSSAEGCYSPRILMQIRVLFFGALKELVGRSMETIDLPDGAYVNDVLARYDIQFPNFGAIRPSLAISVNQEYSGADRVLTAGDEVGLLPPVSGGAPGADALRGEVQIVRAAISTQATLDRLKHPEDGAAVVFDGIVRDNTRGRRTLYLDYEAYEPMALKQMNALAQQARERFGVAGVSIVHRLGRLQIGEISVLIVVVSAHRAAAFEACRWIIDTLKKTVPIWKKEYFEDGAVWVDGEAFPEEIQRPVDTTGQQPASK
jgi:MoaE-MoaD fusion protein